MNTQPSQINAILAHGNHAILSISKNEHLLEFYSIDLNLLSSINGLPNRIINMKAAKNKICASAGGSTLLFDNEKIKELSSINTDTSSTKQQHCIAINDTAEFAGSGCEDTNIYIIKIENCSIYKTIKFHTKPVIDISFMGNKNVVSIAEDKVMAITDIATGNCLNVLNVKINTLLPLTNVALRAKNTLYSVSKSNNCSYITTWKCSEQLVAVNTLKFKGTISDIQCNERNVGIINGHRLVVLDDCLNIIQVKSNVSKFYMGSQSIYYYSNKLGQAPIKKDAVRLLWLVAKAVLFVGAIYYLMLPIIRD
jgi:WD40 repeat protein